MSASLDATGESVRALLAEREVAQAEVDAEIARAEERRAELEQERAAQHDVVDAAEQAARRGARPQRRRRSRPTSAIARALAAAEGSDRVADLAEEKAKAAHTDRAEKGKPYDADPLFSYLWARGFGTPRYARRRLTPHARRLGGASRRTSSRCAATTGC